MSETKLRLSPDRGDAAASGTSIRTFLDYRYHHHSSGVLPRVSSEKIEITEMIASPRTFRVLIAGGIFSDAAPDLNDNDSGIFQLVDGWQRKCDLNLVLMTA
jgi:hypothetical protein